MTTPGKMTPPDLEPGDVLGCVAFARVRSVTASDELNLTGDPDGPGWTITVRCDCCGEEWTVTGESVLWRYMASPGEESDS